MAEEIERYHDYFGEATAITGHLTLPFAEVIRPRGNVRVIGVQGGYDAKQEREYRLESAIHYRSAYTQVGGNRDLKTGRYWTTLATSVVEGLNVFDIVTADRLVAHIAADHPADEPAGTGYVPKISFLGTRFENLRIAGCPVKIDLDLNQLGPKPADDAPYTQSESFLERVTRQRESICSEDDLPPEVLERYNRVPSSDDCREGLECSLVNTTVPRDPKEGPLPGRCLGHAIEVPGFGVVYLATVRLVQSDFNPFTGIPMCTAIELRMLDIRMGCPQAGQVVAGQAVVRGTTHP